MLRLSLSILWPSSSAAGIGIGIVFTLVDPMELVVLGQHVHASRSAVYSLGFFILCAIASMASAMSCLLLTMRHPGDKALGGDGTEGNYRQPTHARLIYINILKPPRLNLIVRILTEGRAT